MGKTTVPPPSPTPCGGEGVLYTLLETSDEDVREWAEGVYREYRERARLKSFSEF